jgi:hypothetical protein
VRRHDIDLTSLVAGLVFVAIATAYLVGEYTDVHVGWRWLLPVALIGLGLAGLAGSLRSGLRREPEPKPLPDHAVEPRDEPATADRAAEPPLD